MNHSWVRALLSFLVGASLLAAQGIITTIAGGDVLSPVGTIPAHSLPLSYGWGMAADQRGNVYVTDTNLHVVYRVAPDGTASVIAGTGFCLLSGDGGPARLASLCAPYGVAVDHAGNVYIADSDNYAVRRISADGIITTLAGGTYGQPMDNVPGSQELFKQPRGIAVDAGGNVYVSDFSNRILVIDPSGRTRFFAGSGSPGYTGDGGPALQASIVPFGLAVDSAGNLYIADYSNFAIRKVDTRGIITSVIGSPNGGSLEDGVPASKASVFAPYAVAIDNKGTLYVADAYNHRVRVLGSDGIVRTLAGIRRPEYSGDGGPAVAAGLNFPIGLAVDPSGNVFISDTFNHVIRRVDSSSRISTYAGNAGSSTSAPAPALNVRFDDLLGMTTDRDGNVYVGDNSRSVVWRVARDGTAQVVAGNGLRQPYSGTPQAATSISIDPFGLATDQNGNLYIASYDYNRVIQVSRDGVATVFAGTGAGGYNGDGGPAVQASLSAPYGLALDAAGNVYIADHHAARVRKVSPDGRIATIAGNGKVDLLGDGGPATATSIYAPVGVAVDKQGNIYISERDDHFEGEIDNVRIRKITIDGIMRTIAGTGKFGYSQDGLPATQSALENINGLALDAAGNVYFSEYDTSRIRTITGNGTLQTVAGRMFRTGYAGDGGLATLASLNRPNGIAFDANGNLYIADQGNHRVRKVLASLPTIAVDTASMTFSGSAGGAPAAPLNMAVTASIPGVPFTVTTDASASAWLKFAVSNAQTPRVVEVTADPASLAPGQYRADIQVLSPNALPSKLTVPVTFNVGPSQPAQLKVDKQVLSFTLPRSGGVQSQLAVVANTGSGTFTFAATATTRTGGNWLSVVPVSADVSARAPATLTVTANVRGLAPGTYSGSVQLTTVNAGTAEISVILTVSAADQALLLTQTGLSFTAVSGGGQVPPQSFGVVNLGTGNLAWRATASTLTGGQWLRVSPATGGSPPLGSPAPTALVGIDQTNLKPARYYGLIRIDAPGAANTPQVVAVNLDVLPPDADPGAVVQPNELVFTTQRTNGAGFSQPGVQEVFVYNLTGNATSFRAASATDSPAVRYLFLPSDSAVSPAAPTRMEIQPLQFLSSPGVVRGSLTLQFNNGQVRQVPLRIEVSASSVSASSASSKSSQRNADGCVPSKLIPVVSLIGQSAANVPAGWPAALTVDVKDDCFQPASSGLVVVSFSNGDPPISLSSLQNGTWQGTWNVRSTAPQVTLRITASDTQRNLSGTAESTADLQALQQPPLLPIEGIVSAASAVSNQPLAPGSIISLYGQRLADATASAPVTPLPSSLASMSAFIGGRLMPLFYASGNQVNAIVPWDLVPNTSHQVLVVRGGTYSAPVSVNVAPAQPSMFPFPQDGAPRQGIFIAVRVVDGKQQSILNTPSAPARAGDTLVIYCLGMGPVKNRPSDGAVSPTSPLAETQEIPVLRIGGSVVPVSFSGLSPGLVGLYQVQASLPSNVAKGAAVPVTIEIAGQLSVGVTVAIE